MSKEKAEQFENYLKTIQAAKELVKEAKELIQSIQYDEDYCQSIMIQFDKFIKDTESIIKLESDKI